MAETIMAAVDAKECWVCNGRYSGEDGILGFGVCEQCHADAALGRAVRDEQKDVLKEALRPVVSIILEMGEVIKMWNTDLDKKFNLRHPFTDKYDAAAVALKAAGLWPAEKKAEEKS
jgi:hypothetical protein